MAEYTYKELMKMQNDAIRRAEDMKTRAQQQAGLTENSSTGQVPVDKPKRIPMPGNYLNTTREKTEKSTNALPRNTQKNNIFDTVKNNFKDLNIDPDRALLLSLILLLSEEKADETLIMALLYML